METGAIAGLRLLVPGRIVLLERAVESAAVRLTALRQRGSFMLHAELGGVDSAIHQKQDGGREFVSWPRLSFRAGDRRVVDRRVSPMLALKTHGPFLKNIHSSLGDVFMETGTPLSDV